MKWISSQNVDRFYEIFIFNFNLFMRIVSIIQFKKENSDKRIIIE